jgi:hypothetical protein
LAAAASPNGKAFVVCGGVISHLVVGVGFGCRRLRATIWRGGFGGGFGGLFCGEVTDAHAVATGLSIGALHACTWVIFAFVCFAEAAKSTLWCIGLAKIFGTGAIDARFVALAGDAITWIGDTCAILADFAGGATWTGFDTGAIGGTAYFVGAALFVGTWVFLAATVLATLVVLARLSLVAAGLFAGAVDADAIAGALDVNFAGAVSGALAIDALFATVALDAFTGIGDTFVDIALASLFAGLVLAFAKVFDTGAILACFVGVAGHIGAWVCDAFAFDADFFLRTEDACTGTNAGSVFAVFAVVACFSSAGVFGAFAFDAAFVCLTVAIFLAGWRNAFVVDAKIIALAIGVKLAIFLDALSIETDLAVAWAGDGKTWIVGAIIELFATDAAVFALVVAVVAVGSFAIA